MQALLWTEAKYKHKVQAVTLCLVTEGKKFELETS